LLAISHVLSAKHAQPKHLSRRELRLKLRIEIAPCGFGQVIPIVLLHPVVDPDGPCLPQASFWGHVASLGSCRSSQTEAECADAIVLDSTPSRPPSADNKNIRWKLQLPRRREVAAGQASVIGLEQIGEAQSQVRIKPGSIKLSSCNSPAFGGLAN